MDTPTALVDFARTGALVEAHRPWPRYKLDHAGWQRLIEALSVHDWSLVALWGEPVSVHVALRDEADGAVALLSLDCPDARFPSLSAVRPGALRLERALRDLVGIEAEDAWDTRPWLDHGTWRLTRPLSRSPAATPGVWEPRTYPFLPVHGAGLHEIPVGPVHAGIIEPGHFRFTANGETVVRLEQRLGYVHKGTQALMAGKPPAEAARLAGRISGDSTVAHAFAFARAVEAALGLEAPPRAVWLRALMAELERIANHFGDVGAICNDASFVLMHAECGWLRERVLQAADQCFGHRLMMDRVTPGGTARDLGPDGRAHLVTLLPDLRRRLAHLVRIYDAKSSLLDRTVGTGVTSAELVHRFAAGGHVGRAASRGLDARRSPSYPPYDDLDFEVPVLPDGDVNARVWIRIHEIEQSLRIIEQILDRLPEGATAAALTVGAGEGSAVVESFRGEIFTWVRLDTDGMVAAAMPRDPSWFQWPLLEAAIEGNIVADFPLCNKSFNCSYSGHDL